MGVFYGGMTSTQRSESGNHLFKQLIPRGSPMHQFVCQYNNFLKLRISDDGWEQHATKMKICVYRYDNLLEQDASRVYTRSMFEKLKEEMYHCGAYFAYVDVPGMKYTVQFVAAKQHNKEHNKKYHITIEDGGVLCVLVNCFL